MSAPPNEKRYDGPTQTATEVENRWEAHPGLARSLRVSIVLVPLIITFALTWYAGRHWPPERVGLNRWVWWIILMFISWALMRGLNHLARKATPIAAMLQVSMIFPDEAPSRARTALRATNGKKILRDFREAEAAGENPPHVPSSDFLAGMLRALSEHEPLTRGHSERVRAYTDLIAEELELPEEDQHKLRWAALLHDVGKLEVPAEILNSKSKPTDEEWEILKTHPVHGGRMLEPLRDWLGDWVLAAEEHHLRWDGRGYPKSLAGTEISLAGRIVAVADAYDVMTSIRSYKKGMSPESARKEIARCSGAQFDPMVVRAFLAVGVGRLRAALGPFGSIVGLLETFRVPLNSGVIATAGTAAAGAAAATIGAVTGLGAEPIVEVPSPDVIPFVEPVALRQAEPSFLVTEDTPGEIVLEGAGGIGRVTITIGPASEGTISGGVQTLVSEPGDEWSFELDYQPTADFNGVDSFNYTICDEADDCITGTATIVVDAVNDAPIPADDRAVALVAGPLTVNAVANDFDPDGDDLRIVSIGRPTNGTAVIVGDSIRYLADPDFRGIDQITYSVVDAAGAVATARVTFDMTNLNSAPVAGADSATVFEDGSVVIDVLANDTDTEDGTPGGTVTIVRAPDHGSVTVDDEGRVSYTPDPEFHGADSFEYRVGDSEDKYSDPARVEVIVGPVNDPPRLNPGGDVTIAEDAGPVAVNWASGMDAGAREEDQTVLIATTSDNPGLFAVQPSLGPDGVLTFSALPDTVGSATVSITLTDDGGTADGGTDTTGPFTFVLSIVDVNDPPKFSSGGDVTVLEDAGLTSLGWATAIEPGPPDEADQTVSFAVSVDNPGLFSTQPTIGPDGVLEFATKPNRNGTTLVTVTLSDDGGTIAGGSDTSSPQSFLLTVQPVNDSPTFLAGPDVNVSEDSIPFEATWATEVKAGPPNESSQGLLATVTNDNPALFDVEPQMTPDGTLRFTASPDANGTAAVSVTFVDDGGSANGGSDTSVTETFVLTVGAMNDAPTFVVGPNVSVFEDAGAYGSPWATAIASGPADESGQTLTFTVTNDFNALFAIPPDVDEATGDLTFTPAPDAVGTATVTVTLGDDGGTANGGEDTSPTESFTITVTPVNDEPSFGGADVTVNEDSGAYSALWASPLSAGPPDESGQTLTFTVGNDNPLLFAAPPAIASDGTLTFTAAADVSGQAVVTVDLADDGGTANGGDDSAPTQTFTLTVNPVNDAPSFDAGSDVIVLEDSAPHTELGWATNMDRGPIDESGQVLDFTVTNDNNLLFATQPDVDETTGDLSFTVAADAAGSATVTVTLSDDGGTANGGVDSSAPATFLITITEVNDAPLFTAGPDIVVDEDSGPFTLNPWATGIAAGPASESGQNLTFAATVSDGTAFSGAPAISVVDGELSFTPAPDAFGVFDVDVWLWDDGGTANGGTDTSPIQTFTITLTGQPDDPTAAPDSFTGFEDTTLSVAASGVLANDADVDGDTLTVNTTPVAGPTNGVVVLNGDGSFDYTPNPGYEGPDSFTYELDDGTGRTDTAVVSIDVQPVDGVVISQYSSDNAHTDGDFVEIYNAAPNPIDISGWEMHIADKSSIREVAVIPGGTILPPGGFYLFGRAGDGVDAIADQTVSDTFRTEVGFGLWDGAVYVDRVGTYDVPDVAVLVEGRPIPRLTNAETSDLDLSYRRLGDFGGGHCQDTDDNAADFHTVFTDATPRNSSSPTEPCGPPTPPGANPGDLVFSEIRTNGPNGTDDDFVEIFNPTSAVIGLGGLRLYTDGDLEFTFPAIGLQPGEHFLIGGDDYAGPVDGAMSNTGGIDSPDNVHLWHTTVGTIDFVDFDTSPPGLPELDNNYEQSYRRVAGGCLASGVLLDDYVRTPVSNPQSLADPPTPCP